MDSHEKENERLRPLYETVPADEEEAEYYYSDHEHLVNMKRK